MNIAIIRKRLFVRRFSVSSFSCEDPFRLESSLNSDELNVLKVARDFSRTELMPRILLANRNETFDASLMKEMGSLGLLGSTIHGFGGAGVNYLTYGLIAREVEYVDSAYRSALSVQSSLVCSPIDDFGSQEQKQKYLPELIAGRLIGCFGLTEPGAGSDPGSMLTNAKRDGNSFVLNGTKTWITNAPVADVMLVWAKLEGEIRGFLIDRNELMSGSVSTPKIEGKLSLRASVTGQIILEDARIPLHAMMPGGRGLKGPFSCLNRARFGISFGVMGAAQFCLDRALMYTSDRRQFNRPLNHTQLVQVKLADMMTEIALGLNGSCRMGQLMDSPEGCSPNLISLLKRNNCGKALAIARVARDMMGANGISDEYHVMRVANNLEAVNTYEGTHDVHGLILGRALTGHPAF